MDGRPQVAPTKEKHSDVAILGIVMSLCLVCLLITQASIRAATWGRLYGVIIGVYYLIPSSSAVAGIMLWVDKRERNLSSSATRKTM